MPAAKFGFLLLAAMVLLAVPCAAFALSDISIDDIRAPEYAWTGEPFNVTVKLHYASDDNTPKTYTVKLGVGVSTAGGYGDTSFETLSQDVSNQEPNTYREITFPVFLQKSDHYGMMAYLALPDYPDDTNNAAGTSLMANGRGTCPPVFDSSEFMDRTGRKVQVCYASSEGACTYDGSLNCQKYRYQFFPLNTEMDVGGKKYYISYKDDNGITLNADNNYFYIPFQKWTLLKVGGAPNFVYVYRYSPSEYELRVEIPDDKLENFRYASADSGNLLKDGHLLWWPQSDWKFSSDSCINRQIAVSGVDYKALAFFSTFNCQNVSLSQLIDVSGEDPYSLVLKPFAGSYVSAADGFVADLSWLDGNYKVVKSEEKVFNENGLATGIARPEGAEHLNLTIVQLGRGNAVLDNVYFGTVPLNVDKSFSVNAAPAPPQGNVTKQVTTENTSIGNAAETPKAAPPGILDAILGFLRKLFAG